MKTLKIDMLKFTGARHFQSKDGTDHIAIPVVSNNIFTGAKGSYCSLILMENKAGTDEWGNDGFAVLEIAKERREQGEKGPIVGNWRELTQRNPNQNAAPPPKIAAMNDDLDEDEELPF